MTGDIVFIGVSVTLIAIYTGYNIWVLRRQSHLFRKFKHILEENRTLDHHPHDVKSNPAGNEVSVQ